MKNFYSTQKNELQGFSPKAQPSIPIAIGTALKLNPQSKLFALLFAFFAMLGGVWAGGGSASTSYSASTVTHPTTSLVTKGSTNQQILLIQIDGSNSGSGADWSICEMKFQMQNTNNSDVSNAKLYYNSTTSSGSTNTLADGTAGATLLGTVSNPSGVITFSFGTTLNKAGPHYFYLTYDISSSATISNTVDAYLTSVKWGTTAAASGTCGGTATTVTTGFTTPNPTGSRIINYCAADASTVYAVNSVAFNTINNADAGTVGYQNFTNLSTTLYKNNTYGLTVTAAGVGTNASYVNVFIDWNIDGDFVDAGEEYQLGVITTGAPFSWSQNITVPSGATIGTTRMRVFHRILTGYPTPCLTIANGQVEDYTLSIQNQAACSGTPAPGAISATSPSSCSTIALSSTLSLETPLTDSGLSYQWQESTNNSTWSDISGATSATYAVSLTSADKYFRVKVTCSNGGGIGYSTSLLIFYDCSNYCASNATSTADSRIDRVQFNTIDQQSPSTCQSYTNYTNVSTTVIRGASHTLTITKGTCNATYTGRFGAWIDWNRDGDFADAGEQVLTDAAVSNGPVSATVTIPADASLGSTRMRCIFREASVPTACGTYTYGETEDYAVIICANPTISSPTADATVSKCSGENTSFSVTATTPSGGGATTYQWQVNTGAGYSNLSNTGVYTGATEATLNLTGVTTAMNGYLYRCIVSSGCGGSATSFVTTLNVGAAPTASAGGSTTICANSTATVAGASANNGTIAWTENGGGSITANSTATNPTYTPLNSNESGSVTMTMTVTGTSSGCTSTTATATYTITVNPNPAISVGSNPAVCQGTTSASLTYSSLTNGGNQFSIDYDGVANTAGFTDVTNSSTTSSPISLVVPVAGASGTYDANLTVRNSSTGCSSTSSTPIQVTINKVDVTMGTTPQVCQGITTANLAFTIADGAPTQYTIDFDNTANAAGFTDITSFTNFASSPIAVTVPVNPNTATYNGTITFKNPTTNCTETESFSIIVTSSPQVSSFSMNNPNVCAGFGNTLTVTSTSLATGTYTVTYDVSGANSATGLTSTLNFTAGSPGTGTFTTGTLGSTGSTTITVTQLTSGCSSSLSSGNTSTFTVNASPATPTASYTGAGTGVCEGSPLTLSATGSTGTYTWSGPNSYSTTGATPTVSSTATTSLAGTYSVYATNNGCQSQTATTTVTINTVGITLGSNPSVCLGVTSANLTYSGVSGSPSQYSIDYNAAANTAGFTDVSLATLSSSPIVLTVPSNPGSGTFSGTLTVKNTTNGCVSNTSYPISVTVNALPTISLGSSPTICRGASSANLTYTAQSGANEYALDFDATAEGLGFADVALTSLGASPVAVTTPTGATNGTYNANLTVKNTTTGCTSNPYSWTVTLTSPTVTASASPDAFCDANGTNSTTITASGATSYSWNTGETTNQIVKTVSSTTTYTVTGTTSGCSSQTTVTVSVGEGTSLYSSTFETASECANWVGQATTTPASNGNHWAMGRTITAVATGWYNMLVTSCGVQAIAGSYSPRAINFKTGGSVAYCTTNENQLASTSKRLYSPSISSTGYGSLKLTFKYEGTLSANNNVKLQYSTDGGTNWTDIETYSSNVTGTRTVNLPSALNNIAAFRLGFLLTTDASTAGSFVFDNFSVTGNLYPTTPNTPTGAVTSRCTNSSITNTYTINVVNGATSYAWAITPAAAGTISGTTTTGTVTWNAGWTGTATITAAAVNCAGTGSYSSGLSVTISAQPGVTTPTAGQTVCANVAPSALSVTASGGSGTTSYQWYSNTSNSTAGGTMVGTNSNSYSPPASGTVGSTYYYCIVSNNGTNCVNATSPATATITVNPIPVGTSSLATQSICSGQTSTVVNLSTSNNVTGTTFTWTRNKTTEVTGIANSGSGSSIASSTLTNTTLTTQTVVFTITPTGPASTNCGGSTYTVSITVTPGATVNAGSNIAAGTASTPCKTVSPSAISLTGASIGGSASDAAWSITSGTGTLSSTVSSATPGTITYTPGSNESGTVTLTLTTNDPDGGGGCTAVSATKTIFIETPVTITTATDYVSSTTTCGQTQLTLAHDGADGSGQWEFDASVLPNSSTNASITIDAGTSTYNTNITASWNATSQCPNVTKTIRFNQPVTSSISNLLTSNNSWLWGGLTSTTWGTASNWYKWDGSKWLQQTSSTPSSSTDRVFTLSNSDAGLCVSASNTPALATNPTLDDLDVGPNTTLNLGSNTITINGDFVNDGTVNASTGTVVFSASSGNQTISGSQPITFNNLTINKNAGNVIISTPVTINGTLSMAKGNIVNSSLITLGSSSSSTGTLSHTAGTTITGALRRYFANSTGTNYYFPIGNATYTRGVTVNMSQAPGIDQYITAEYKSGTPQVNGATLYSGLPLTTADGQLIQNYDNEGYWQIDPKQYDSGIDAANYTISLQMNNISGVNDYTKTRIIKADGPSHVSWSALTHSSATGSNTNFTLTASGTGFSWFNGGGDNNNNPLPVELVSFTGACDNGVISLTWQTASEFNSSHFDVEKSRDGENWQVLTTMPSAGTSNELITYQSTDQNGTEGNNYFRLRQVDVDGTEKLYDPINVSCSEVTTGYFSSFPNPSGSAFQVILNNKELIGTCTMNVVDASGKVIEQRTIDVKEGINLFVINQDLNPGIYFLNVTNGTKSTPVFRHAIK